METQTTFILRIKKDAVETPRTRNEESCLEKCDTHIKYFNKRDLIILQF